MRYLVREDAFLADALECMREIVPLVQCPVTSYGVSPEAQVRAVVRRAGLDLTVRRGELLNWVAITEVSAWTEESWSTEGDLAEVRRTYAGWDERLLRIFDATERCYKWALYDREPLVMPVSGPKGDLRAVARRALAALGRADREVHVTVVDDRRIRALNARYLGTRRATDVLAFDLAGLTTQTFIKGRAAYGGSAMVRSLVAGMEEDFCNVPALRTDGQGPPDGSQGEPLEHQDQAALPAEPGQRHLHLGRARPQRAPARLDQCAEERRPQWRPRQVPAEGPRHRARPRRGWGGR